MKTAPQRARHALLLKRTVLRQPLPAPVAAVQAPAPKPKLPTDTVWVTVRMTSLNPFGQEVVRYGLVEMTRAEHEATLEAKRSRSAALDARIAETVGRLPTLMEPLRKRYSWNALKQPLQGVSKRAPAVPARLSTFEVAVNGRPVEVRTDWEPVRDYGPEMHARMEVSIDGAGADDMTAEAMGWIGAASEHRGGYFNPAWFRQGGEHQGGVRLVGEVGPERQSFRQIGTTSRQMRAAQHGATYLWGENHLSYPRDLARHLGRTDLRIVGPEWLRGGNYLGLRSGELVVDHAAHEHLTAVQADQLRLVAHEIARRPPRAPVSISDLCQPAPTQQEMTWVNRRMRHDQFLRDQHIKFQMSAVQGKTAEEVRKAFELPPHLLGDLAAEGEKLAQAVRDTRQAVEDCCAAAWKVWSQLYEDEAKKDGADGDA